MIKKILIWIVITLFLVSSIASVYATQFEKKENSFREQFREREKFREQFREMKEKLNQCVNNESEKCKEIRKEAFEVAKNRFCNIIDFTIEIMENIKVNIDKNRNLNEEEKKIIKESIDEEIIILKNQKEKCNRINELAKLKELLEEYKKRREQFRERERLGIEKVRERRIGLIIVKAEKLVDKLEKFLEKYNKTDPELEKLVNEFKEKIELANKSRNEAIALWEELHQKIKNKEVTSNEIRKTVNEIHEKLEKAKSYLEEAKNILKEIIFRIKGIEKKEESKNISENITSK